jgi:signal transduction histidine kinase/PAS domain-containing protein
MPGLPAPVLTYLQFLALENHAPAYLRVDKDGSLSDWGGEVAAYGLKNLRRGASANAQVLFLESLLPLQSSPLVLPSVALGEERFVDIHIFSDDGGDWVLLLDATAAEAQRRHFQQKVNELGLLNAQQARELAQSSQPPVNAPLVADIFTALNVVLLERATNGAFRLLGSAPDWLLGFYPEAASPDEDLHPGDKLPVLENFLVDAEQFWQEKRTGRLCSGLWTETDAAGQELPLEASALWVRGRKILLIERLNGLYEKKQSLIQTAREHSLRYHQLESRLQRLLDQLHVGVFRSTLGGELLYANPAYTRILGTSSGEIVKFLGEQAHTQPVQQHEVKIPRQNGDALWVSLSATHSMEPSGATIVDGLLEDITERKRAEEARQEDAAVVEALSRVGRELIALLDAPTILNRLCQLTTEALGCDSSHAFLWKAAEGVLVPMAGHGDPPERWETLRVARFPQAAVADALARLERDGVAQEVTADPREGMVARLQRHLGVTVGLYVALRQGGTLVGVLSAGYRNRGELFTPRQERIARGISQLASLALQNARLVEELERASRLKEDFLAMFSHELRTPLNIILGYNDLLLDGTFGDLSDEQSEALRRADKSARELAALVAATLDLSRLEMEQVPLDFQEVSLPELMKEVQIETEEWGEKAGLQQTWKIAPELPLLRTDPLKLKIIIKNLINNAVKFTERGNITVDVHLHASGVGINVTDTGVGIAPEAMPIIFEPFRQADSSMTRRYGGVGLGLHVVRRFLDLLRGTVTVESEVGRGSTFRIFLPIA